MYRSKHRTASSGDAITFIFGAILLSSAWSYWALLAKVMIGIILASLLLVFVYVIRKVSWNRKLIYSQESIDRMSGIAFERCVAQLVKRQGFTQISLTERYDFGVDIVAVKNGVTWGIQVKRHNNMVKADAVRQVVTALRKYNCDRAMVVTNSYFSRVASELAKSNDCKLIDRRKLSDWLMTF